MKTFCNFIVSCFLITGITAQSCLPEGIIFETQAQIDSFQYNYPGCTEIEGDVIIGIMDDTSNIINLNALAVIQSVEGDLRIVSNDSLPSLSGLDALVMIGGDLEVNDNHTLTNLSGLEALITIGGDLIISNNFSLNSLSGLNDIDVSTVINLTISGNGSLTYCNNEWVCEYLQNPNGTVEISLNAGSCTSIVELANSCGGNLPCLPYGNYSLYSEDDIFMFQYAFNNCSEIKGSVLIQGSSDIYTLHFLENWASVENNLIIRYSSGLEDLTGLHNLQSVGGDLSLIHNENLSSVEELGNIVEIGGQLRIVNNDALNELSGLENIANVGSDLEIYGNYNLISIEALMNLDSIGGNLWIFSNESLESLAGIDNIEPESIEYLYITDNPLLSHCEVLSVCSYLEPPASDAEISGNATGCATRNEVEEACIWIGVSDLSKTLQIIFI